MKEWRNSIKRYFAILLAFVMAGVGAAITIPSADDSDGSTDELYIYDAEETGSLFADDIIDDLVYFNDSLTGEDYDALTDEEMDAESYVYADDGVDSLYDAPDAYEGIFESEADMSAETSDDIEACDITYASDTVSEVTDSSDVMQLLADTWDDAADAEESDSQFAMKRLILIADELYDDYDAAQILHYAKYDEYVLQFDTEEETEAAYYEIVDTYGEDSCFPDEIVTAEELWGTDDYTDEYTDEEDTYDVSLSTATIDTVTDITVDEYDTWGAAFMGLDYLKAQMDYVDIDDTLKIAVIDSGIDDSHDKFDGRIDYTTSCYIFKEDDAAVSSDDFSDGLGHGTHVSGIIADCTPDNVSLMIIKTFDDTGSSTSLAISTAMQYAIENNASIMNMSLGWFSESAANYTFLDSIITEAKNEGIVICAAAGNQAGDVVYAYPANNEDVITVSAISSSGNFATSYSNYGSTVDFCAPGTSIYNTYTSGKMATVSGTSMATPHVSSAIAYIMLAEPGLSVDQIESRLQEYAVDGGDEGWDEKYGYGYIYLYSYFNDLQLPVREVSTATPGDADEDEEEETTPESPSSSFKYYSLTKTYLDAAFTNALTTNSDGTISYSSSDTSVAKVDSSGKVTIAGVGTCKITASVSATDAYRAASLSYSLTVNAKSISSFYAVLSATTCYYTGSAIKPTVKLKTSSSASSYISTSYYTVSYSNNVSLGTGKVTITGKGNYTGTLTKTFTITLGKATISSLANSTSGVTIKWNKVTGASGYIVYRKTYSGSWARLKVLSGINNISYVDTTAVSGTYYYYLVRPYNGSTLGGYGNYPLIKRLARPTFTRKNTNAGIYLSWGKITGASGYIIYRKANNATTWTRIKVVSSSVLHYTDTSVSVGSKYTYTIRAYCGSYRSSYHAGAAMYRMVGRTVYYGKNNAKGKLYLKWYADNYVTGYQVAYSTSSSFSKFKYVTISGNKKNYTTLSNLTKGRYYYITVRSYRTVNGVTYYSNWGKTYKIYVSK